MSYIDLDETDGIYMWFRIESPDNPSHIRFRYCSLGKIMSKVQPGAVFGGYKLRSASSKDKHEILGFDWNCGRYAPDKNYD